MWGSIRLDHISAVVGERINDCRLVTLACCHEERPNLERKNVVGSCAPDVVCAQVDELTSELAAQSNSTVIVKTVTQSTTRMSSWRQHVRHLAKEDQDALIYAYIKKVLCARGEVFYGSPLSTFTMEISRLRYGMHASHCRDTTLCFGEKEW